MEGLEFSDATGTDQATRDRVNSLEAALEKDARADGTHPGAGKVRLLEASVANHSAAGRATLRFLGGFEKLTGKKVYWIDTERAASFAAIVDTARPNAIYLHVQGNRAIPRIVLKDTVIPERGERSGMKRSRAEDDRDPQDICLP